MSRSTSVRTSLPPTRSLIPAELPPSITVGIPEFPPYPTSRSVTNYSPPNVRSATRYPTVRPVSSPRSPSMRQPGQPTRPLDLPFQTPISYPKSSLDKFSSLPPVQPLSTQQARSIHRPISMPAGGASGNFSKLPRSGHHMIGNVEVPDEFYSFALAGGNKLGLNGMHQAAIKGNAAAIEWLYQHNYLLDSVTIDGITPIHFAALHNHPAAVETIIRLGSGSIDAKDKHGDTPMHYAARLGYIFVMDLLIHHGSKALLIQNQDQDPPVGLVYRYGFRDEFETYLDSKVGSDLSVPSLYSVIESIDPQNEAMARDLFGDQLLDL